MPRRLIRKMRAFPAMTVLWLTMGVLVTAGFYLEARDDQARCEAGNEFRRDDLPAAFDLDHEGLVELGRVLGADGEQMAAIKAYGRDIQAGLDELFPERDCPLLW